MKFDMARTRHPKEAFYGTLVAIVGGIVWALLGLFVLGSMLFGSVWTIIPVLFYALILWGASAVVRALLRAYMIGNHVMVSEEQFRPLHLMVRDGAKLLGLTPAPQAYVYNSAGVMNALALRLIGNARYVWISSAVLDADNEEQIRFVVGHELGHHVAGHLDWRHHLLTLPGRYMPLLGQAYSRACELTCDRIGAFVAREPRAAAGALQMLALGSARLNASMNVAAFRKQEAMVPPIAGFFVNIASPYPRLTRRVDEVLTWVGSMTPAAPPAPVAAIDETHTIIRRGTA